MPCPVTFRFVARNLPTRARVMAWAPRENHLPFLVSSFPFFPFFRSTSHDYYPTMIQNPGGGSISMHVYIQIFFRPPSFRSPLPGRTVPPPPPRSGKSRVSIYSPPVNPRFISALIDTEGRRGLNCVIVDSKLKRWILISDGGWRGGRSVNNKILFFFFIMKWRWLDLMFEILCSNLFNI